MLFRWQSRTTGVTSPSSMAVAKPMCTAVWRTSASPLNSALSSGAWARARAVAFSIRSLTEILPSASERFNRSRRASASVTSISPVM